MRKAESSLANPGAIALSALRACLIFFGTTAVAYNLAAGTTDGRFRPLSEQDFTTQLSGEGLPSYLSWLGGALSMDQDLLRPLANTVWLAVVAVLFGLGLGVALSGLLRVRGLRQLAGGLNGPILALTVPGVLLFPVYRWADTQQLLPAGPSSTEQAASSSVWFLAFWGASVGLALAPGIAGQLATEQRHRSGGAELAANTGASLPFRFWQRSLGAPTAVLLLGLASAELISGHNGLFRFVADRFGAGDLVAALDVVAVVALLGALVALAADLLSVATKSPTDRVEPDQPVRLSEATWPLLAALVVLMVVAVVGYLRDPILTAGQNPSLRTPAFGGPWLGTDGGGVSFVERVVIALGPTMSAAIIPGLLAGAVGGAIQWVTHRAPSVINRAVNTAIDVFWWPLPLVIPLAHLRAGNPERSEFDLTVTAVTVAALAPLAVRAVRRSAGRGQLGWQPLLSVAVFLVAIAGSLRIFVGFLGVTNGPHGPANADLGALLASSAASSGLDAVWSVMPPALAGVALLSLLYWLAGAISAPVPYRELAPATPEQDPTAEDLLGAAASASPETTARVGPLGPEELRSIVRQQPEAETPSTDQDIMIGRFSDAPQAVSAVGPADEAPDAADDSDGAAVAAGSEDDITPDGEDEVIDVRARPADPPPVQRRPIVNLAERTAAASLESVPPEGSEDDVTVLITPTTDAAAGRNTQNQVTSDQKTAVASTDSEQDQDIDEQTQAELDLLNATSTDLAADASKTIELRPSTLRRAGIVAPGATPPPDRKDTRPILASKAEDYERDKPSNDQTGAPSTDAEPGGTDRPAGPEPED